MKLKINADTGEVIEEGYVFEEAVVEEVDSRLRGNDMSGDASASLEYRSSKWFRAGKKAMSALVLLLPLFFLPGTMAPVLIAKTALVFGVALFALIAYVAIAISHRRLSYPHSGFFLATVFFSITTGISAWFSIARTTSIYGNFIDPNSFLSVLAYSLLFFLATYFWDEEDAPRIGKLFLYGVSIATVIGIFQAFGVHLLPWAFAKDSGFTTIGSLYGWGVMMAMALSALSVMPYAELSRRGRIMALVSGALMVFGLFVLNYPTIWVGLALLMIMISAARFVGEEKLGAPIILAVASVCLALLASHLPRVGSLPAEASPNLSVSWSVAKQSAVGKRMLVGTGPSTFAFDYNLHRPAELNQTVFWNAGFNQGYNAFVTMYANQGILGVVALLLLIGLFLRQMIAGFYDPLRAPLTAMLLMGFIAWFFFPMFLVSSAYLFIGLGLLGTLGGARREVPMRQLRPAGAFVSFMALLVLVACTVSLCYFLAQKYYAAYAYAKGTTAFSENKSAQGVEYLKSAVQWDSSSDVYLRGLSQGLLVDARNQLQAGGTGNSVAIQQELALAVQTALRAIQENPKDSSNYVNAGGIYENLISIATGAERAAQESYTQASLLNPTDPSNFFSIARAYMAAADQQVNNKTEWQARVDVAKQSLQKALELKPDYAPAHFLLAQIYLKEGNSARAVERVEAIKASNPYDPGIAFQLGLLYYESGQTELSAAEFERALSFSPDYANAMYFLGLAYDKQGKTDAALAQFRRVKELNPDNAEVTRIISNLESGRHALQDIAPPATPPEKRSSVPVPDTKKKP